MTQALMDLSPRVDTTPVGRRGDPRESTDSGAAFAEAVDQAVSETAGRSDALGRKESGRDEDRRGPDAAGKHDADERDGSAHDDTAAGDAAATVIWALAPHDLHATSAAAGNGRHAAERVDAATAPTTHAARGAAASADAGIASGAATRAQVTAPGTPAAVPAAATSTSTSGTEVTTPRTATSAPAATSGLPAAGTPGAAHGAPADGRTAPGNGHATAVGARPASTAPHIPSSTASADAPKGGTEAATTSTPADRAAAVAPPHRAATATPIGSVLPADGEAPVATAPGLTEPRSRDAARPGAAGRPASHSASAQPSATANTASATSAATSQISPAAVHVPTAVAATVNSTPVAAPAPMPTPFAQAQPDVANILAQLRGRSDGTYQLRAQVHPAELGAVAITATVHHGALTVTLTPDQTAQQAISQSLPQLRQHLADQGFTGVNVGLGSPQSGHQGRGDGDREARAQGSDHSVLHGPDVAIGAVERTPAGRIAGTQSALDLML